MGVLKLKFYASIENVGYIAGTADGIVSVAGQSASRMIYVFDAQTLNWIQTAKSTINGNYLITGLDPNKHYLIMCRDYNRDYEPCVYDYVQPATDLTLAEQMELWQSWQS